MECFPPENKLRKFLPVQQHYRIKLFVVEIEDPAGSISKGGSVDTFLQIE